MSIVIEIKCEWGVRHKILMLELSGNMHYADIYIDDHQSHRPRNAVASTENIIILF